MDHSSTYAHHLARLVSLLLREPGNIDSQMATLRAIASVAALGPIAIERSNAGMTVNSVTDPALAGSELAAQLSAHGLRGIQCAAGASVDELLGVARILVAAPGGPSAVSRLDALQAKSVRFLTQAPAAPAAPTARQRRTPAVSAPRRLTPAAPAPRRPMAAAKAAPVPPRRPTPAAAPQRQPTPRQATPVAAADPPPPRRPTPIAPPSGLMQQDGGALWELFATNAPEGSADELFAELDALTVPNVDRLTKLLNDLVAVAESAAREDKPLLAGEVMRGIVGREPARDDETRRAFALAIRRASQPIVLRCVAQLLPPKPEQRDEHARVLLRAGDDGADALLERLAVAQKAEDRRVYIDVVLWMRATAPALIRDAALIAMLGDGRWFVARTAAELLGEMKVTAAEVPLTELLRHDDERIRRSAAVALLQLGTASGRKAIEDALLDPAPEVRSLAVNAMATADGDERETTASALLRVLDDEQEPDVQLALLAALGRLATPDAVERLSQAAESEGRLFKKKTLEFRLAAVQALGEARTAAALTALKALESDREREVRDAVAHAQVHALRAR